MPPLIVVYLYQLMVRRSLSISNRIDQVIDSVYSIVWQHYLRGQRLCSYYLSVFGLFIPINISLELDSDSFINRHSVGETIISLLFVIILTKKILSEDMASASA